MDTTLYDAVKKINLKIKKAAEIGVLSFEESAVKKFCLDGVPCDLYEAIPDFCKNISAAIKPFPGATLKDFAVSNYNGEMEFCLVGASTFNAAQDHSPAIDHDGCDKTKAKRVTVKCRDFAEIDPGDYDVISIDVEGGEWAIVSRMKSRPKVISLETQSRDYVNPNLGAITDWMVLHGYKVWIWNDTDTIFYKGEPPSLGLKRNIQRAWHNFRYYAGRL